MDREQFETDYEGLGLDKWSAVTTPLGLDTLVDPEGVGSFHAAIKMSGSEALTLLEINTAKHLCRRLRRNIREREWGTYMVYREQGVGAHGDFNNDREVHTQLGDLFVADADEPFAMRGRAIHKHDVWMIPHEILRPHLPRIHKPNVVSIAGGSAVGRLMNAYMDELAMGLSGFTDSELPLVSDHLARLIAIGDAGSPIQDEETLVDARLAEARRFINRSLASPGLDPERTAAALRMSVRQLHKLFARSGETFGQFVRRRRLEECRTTLVSPLAIHRSVADIAYGWGFASMASFYRAFAAAYGDAPNDLRPDKPR
jgi:AraC-like DNA-binding protein